MKALPSIAFNEFKGSVGDLTARVSKGRQVLSARSMHSSSKTPVQAVSRNKLAATIKMEAEPLPYQPTAIKVKTVIDSMGIYLTYKDRFKESTEIREVETIIEKEVNIMYWWQKALMWLGILFSLLFIVKLYFRLKK